jgi:hypothetical protein
MDNIIKFKQRGYEIITFDWGVAIYNQTRKKYETVFILGHQIDLGQQEIIVHDNGIEFI